MVRRRLRVAAVKDLGGASFCPQQGSMSELNIPDEFRAHSLKGEILAFGTNDDAVNAYVGERCGSGRAGQDQPSLHS